MLANCELGMNNENWQCSGSARSKQVHNFNPDSDKPEEKLSTIMPWKIMMLQSIKYW
jgi:hypothetical protein